MPETSYTQRSAAAWERPLLPPLPVSLQGVGQPVLSLAGNWKFCARPGEGFWRPEYADADWEAIPVPSYLPSLGIFVKPAEEYAYRLRLEVPESFRGKRIFLRFDGVNCAARVWVNGEFMRAHYGGFTSWYCELGETVEAGQSALLALGVTDQPREISSFHSGGILRDVRLIALPQDALTRLQVETELDGACRDALLKVTAAVDFRRGRRAVVALSLVGPDGASVALPADEIELEPAQAERTLSIPLAAPALWDGEHPNLYRLEARLAVDGQETETVVRQVGFRKLEIVGNRFLVNGRAVKLRGVNRHDTYPTTGRTVTPELVEADVRLFRDANINFIRTSHYPPREDFLELCDRYGIYVEDEISVAFVYQFIEPTMNDPQHTAHYLGQLGEMVERDRGHACVILWSLANESYWGTNFQACLDYVKREDPARPVIFSYPITIPDGDRRVDVWSLHYGSWDFPPDRMTDNFNQGEANGPALPVLHDEFAHIPCYDFSEQARDPGVREFYGESIKRFWESIFTTPGALGAAIWAGLDDNLILPGRDPARFEWGIIDGWRREKPEYWLTKKAYSPVRVAEAPLPKPAAGSGLNVEVQNWFDHTNLKELEVRWQAGAESGSLPGPDVEPHQGGRLALPRAWADGETLNLRFVRKEGFVVDEYNLPIGSPAAPAAPWSGPAPRIEESKEELTIAGQDFRLVFSKESGLIREGFAKGEKMLAGGPHLHLVGAHLAAWRLEEFGAALEGDQAVVKIRGGYGAVKVCFEMRIDGGGLLTVGYRLEKMPLPSPRSRKLGVGLDVGGYREVGVAFDLPAEVERLEWERKGLWSAYPADHIGRPIGSALRRRAGGDETLGKAPTWPWGQDERNYALFGRFDYGERGTNDFRGLKSGLLWAKVSTAGGGLCVEGDGSGALRLEVLPAPGALIDDDDPRIQYEGSWTQVDGGPGSFGGTERISNQPGAAFSLRFRGRRIAWIGPRDLILGKADVYLDGKLEASGIDAYNPWVIGTARGEEKEPRQILFSKDGLDGGEHTLRVVVTGEKSPRAGDCYVALDALLVADGETAGGVRLHILNEWNYPELTWGNYTKPPVIVEEGYGNTVKLRLAGA